MFVENFHDAAYYGGIRNWTVWLVALLTGAIVAWVGAMIFARLKPHFGSYL
jgi:lipopolysaccharide transport system permease protein